MTNEKRARVAIIIPGGIGTGSNNIGVPVLVQLVSLLAKEFEITVFSLFKVNVGYTSADFEIVDVSGAGPVSKIRKLVSAFRKMHAHRPFLLVHGFWAIPSGLLAVMLGKIFNIKSIVSVLGGDAISLPAINYGQLQKGYKRWLVMWTLRNANEVLALTNFLYNNLRIAGLVRKNVHIIPWGIDVEMFPFNLRQFSDTINFLHIGNLEPVKDQSTLLRAFKLISDTIPAHLTIVGEGRLADSLKRQARDLNIEQEIRFVDPIPYTQLPAYYQRADILLHTSLSEGQSEVVTEAMSSGVVVCGTIVGLIHDLPDCCIQVPVGDYEMLAQQVIKLLHDPDRINAIRANAQQWSSVHSIFWTTTMHTLVYRGLEPFMMNAD
ncbi:MAG TPA: glycosyltransferase [Chryseolinea sp.]|nr:glycosyltransferase [Chryseolinea sp.]